MTDIEKRESDESWEAKIAKTYFGESFFIFATLKGLSADEKLERFKAQIELFEGATVKSLMQDGLTLQQAEEASHVAIVEGITSTIRKEGRLRPPHLSGATAKAKSLVTHETEASSPGFDDRLRALFERFTTAPVREESQGR